jgi:hypothetical protein
MVLVALERIAFTDRIATAITALSRLQKHLRADVRSQPKSQAQAALDAHLFARGMFEVCADIVNRGRKRKMDEHSIRRRLMSHIASRLNDGDRVPCEFSYRATVAADGSGNLEPAAIVARDSRALIALAFWRVAPDIDLVDWRRYKTLKCRVCGGNFRDVRPHLGGGVRTTCSEECRKRDRHRNRRRVK